MVFGDSQIVRKRWYPSTWFTCGLSGDTARPADHASGDYRLHRVFDAMAALGIEAEPAIYADNVVDQVREPIFGENSL